MKSWCASEPGLKPPPVALFVFWSSVAFWLVALVEQPDLKSELALNFSDVLMY
jgi:hypothetical protein